MKLLTLAATALSIASAPAGPLERIAAGESASTILASWCAVHGLPPFRAERLAVTKTSAEHTPAALKPSGRRVTLRRVRLGCGRRTVSTADNWYLPGRLTPAMNARLAISDSPFGQVVQPLGFRRQTLSAHMDAAGRFVIRAVLVDSTGAPFSYVIERYDRRVR